MIFIDEITPIKLTDEYIKRLSENNQQMIGVNVCTTYRDSFKSGDKGRNDMDIQCLIGWHDWQYKYTRLDGTIKLRLVKVCRRCGIKRDTGRGAEYIR